MGCLSVNIRDEGQHLQVSCDLANPLMEVESRLTNTPLQVSCGLVCDANSEFYLYVEPDVIWLTPDMVSEEFDIYSNVVWKIDIEPSEDEKDVVSMLFNELTIDNNTLLINGDTPSLILKMLHNGQMLTNTHYLKN